MSISLQTDAANDRFDRLVQTYYQTWFRFHPEVAVDLGIEGFSDRLSAYDDDEFGALISLQEKLIVGLEELSIDDLDADRQIDYRLLSGQAMIEHHELLEQDWRRRDPVRFLPVHAIYQLTIREVKDLDNDLLARLAAIPDYLRGARTHLQQMPELIPPLWLETARSEATGGAVFLRALADDNRLKISPHRRTKCKELAEAAARSLEEYARFLESDLLPVASGDYACGRDHFNRLLSDSHFLPLDADQLHAFGQALFDKTRSELDKLSSSFGDGVSYQDVLARIQKNHPEPDRLLETYHEQMQAARSFVEAHDLVSLPLRESLQIVNTPVFLRHQIPFAAYMEPTPQDSEQRGLYYVTPATSAELLAEHNIVGIKHTCAHEAWPGHHLQFVTANATEVSRTLPRLVNASATMYEGWALYCEQLMFERGFMEGIEHQLILLRDRMWRALRIMLDVELHTRGLTVEEAAARMQRELGFPKEQALADLCWYTRSPTVPMGYATGWALINCVRDSLQESSEEFNAKNFHDRLLSAGSMSLPLVIQRVFGVQVWEQSMAAAFSGSVSSDAEGEVH